MDRHSLHRETGQIEVSEAGMKANIDTAMYDSAWCKNGAESAGRLISG